MEQETTNIEAQEPQEPELEETLSEEPEDDAVSLESAFAEGGEEPADEGEAASPGSSGQQEPGYIQKRISKAVAETEARMRAEFERQMAPYREHMLNIEAQELVRSGKVKDLDTAKELVRYRQGQPQPLPLTEQPRNAQGQFAPQQEQQDPAIAARLDMLKHQANRIKEQRGIDVISEFQNNEEVKQKIVSGEWDFYDAAEAMSKPQKKKPTAPMRSPNGASGSEKSTIASMTDEQFEKLEKKIKGGTRYAIR